MKTAIILLCIALPQALVARRVKSGQRRQAVDFIDQYQFPPQQDQERYQPPRTQTSQERAQTEPSQKWSRQEQYAPSLQSQRSQEKFTPNKKRVTKSSKYQPEPAKKRFYSSNEEYKEINNDATRYIEIYAEPLQTNGQAQTYPLSKTYRQGSVEVTKYFDSPNPIPDFGSVENDGSSPHIDFGKGITWRGVRIATSRPPVEKRDTQVPSFYKEDIQSIHEDAYNNMRHLEKEEKLRYHEATVEAAKADYEDARLNATELLKKHQYEVETHKVQTDDGYILTMFRIPPKQQDDIDYDAQKKPAVLVMHGLLGSADDWLLMGPGKSLAYLLADAGHEVWLGNARGSKYSRRHVSKSTAQPDFWQFNNDAIALHDLPAMIDYALETSQQKKLHYVAHSLGTTVFFALASRRPEYNDKIITMQAMSPVAYMTNVRSPLMKMIAPNSAFYKQFSSQLSSGKFNINQKWLTIAGGAMAEMEFGCKDVSSNLKIVMSGLNPEEVEPKMIPVIMGHVPAGASTSQMMQYGQAVASKKFSMYDHGAPINMAKYGTEQPPQYELNAVRTPVALYYSEEDWLAHPMDVERLSKELANVTDKYIVPERHFANMDFQYGRRAPELVYSRIIKNIEQNNQQYTSSE